MFSDDYQTEMYSGAVHNIISTTIKVKITTPMLCILYSSMWCLPALITAVLMRDIHLVSLSMSSVVIFSQAVNRKCHGASTVIGFFGATFLFNSFHSNSTCDKCDNCGGYIMNCNTPDACFLSTYFFHNCNICLGSLCGCRMNIDCPHNLCIKATVILFFP